MASKDMAAKVKDLGYNIKGYMSTLEEYEVQEIRRRLRGEASAQTVEKAAPKPVVRRRHQVIRIKRIVRAPLLEEATEAPTAEAEEQLPPPTPAPGEWTPEIATTGEPVSVEAPISAAGPERPVPATAAELETPFVIPAEEVVPSEEIAEEKAGPMPKGEPGAQEEIPVPEEAPTAMEPPPSKTFVKILDRPRIVITPPREQPAREAGGPLRPGAAARPTPPARPSAAVPGEIESGPPLPGKKGKKKAKRVVHISQIGEGGVKKRGGLKWKDRQRPLTKLLVEEIDTDAVGRTPATTEAEFMRLGRGVSKKKGPKAAEQQPSGSMPPAAGKRKIQIYETIQVGELAKRMGVKVSEIIMKLMGLGIMTTANQVIDFDAASLVASDFDYEIEKKAVAEDLLQLAQTEGGEPIPRPPVVTVMGHVDHGKTSLLDTIRQADVASREAGGITQHIGAYHVTVPSGKEVVFLDTPGHEAFTAMRARGAKVTDIVILVVAADDGVMAQTKEAIDHSRAAHVPIIVAVNKIDKPGANPERVKRELADLGLIPEAWGGETIFVDISAKKKIGIDELLEMLALQAEVMDLEADPLQAARGHVIESRLDKGRGTVATVLVMQGTLHPGDAVVCGLHFGRVRAMTNDKGQRVEEAGPSIPVEIQGLSGVPDAGDEFAVLPDEKKAREVAEHRQRKMREAQLAKSGKVSLESIFEKMQEQTFKELNIVLKADVQGSVEAISDALRKLSTSGIKVNIVHSSIGAISESDILLASASEAIVIGFNVRPSPQAKTLAEHEHVDIRFYDVIYQALDEVKSAMVGLLEPVFEEKMLGRAEVRETFHVPKVGTIAGCFVQDGLVQRNARARLLRDNVVVYTGKITSLRRFKEDAKEVQTGYECGMGLERFNDIKVGDVIEAYTMQEVAQVLEPDKSNKDRQDA